MLKNEWPLLVFTLLSQAGVGIFWVSRIFFIRSIRNNTGKYKGVVKTSLWMSFVLIMSSAFFSLFHLGRPERAYLAVSHIFSSRLSQEIFWLIWVGAGTALLLLRIYGKIPGRKLRFILEIFTGAGGIMLIWTMSRLYMIPTVPVWNTAATLSAFYLTALISGSGILLIIVIRKHPYDSPKILKLAGFTSVFVVLQTVNFSLWGPGWGLFAAGNRMLMISLLQGAAGFRLSFSLAGMFLLLLMQHRLKKAGKDGFIRKISAAALWLILLGELTGRWIFYAAFHQIGL